MSTVITAIVAAITSILSGLLGWIGDIVQALFSPATSGPDLTVLGAGLLISLTISILFVAVKSVKSMFWGA